MLSKKDAMPHRKGPSTPATGCLPFFHPTRIVFVDDELTFVRYLSASLNLNSPVSCYASPLQLLAEFASGRLKASIELDCWSNYTDRFADSAEQHLLSLDKTMLMMRVFARDRFDPVSVLVIDYAMPEMNGLELCRRLADLPCRKILLTGQAGATEAVAAFNEGLIDCFLPKGTSTKRLLREQIARFQRAFIGDATVLVRQALCTETLAAWDDSDFCSLFSELHAAHGVVEYYAIADPVEGFVLVNEYGQGRLLLTYTAASLDAQLAAARLSGAPADVLAVMQERRAATFFAEGRGNRGLTAADWRCACVTVQPFATCPDRYFALLDDSEPFDISPRTVLGLRAIMDQQN